MKCFGWFAKCPLQVPDGLNGEILYYKINCKYKDDCFLKWKSEGGLYSDLKLLCEETK